MTIRRTLEIAAFCAALLLASLLFRSWLEAHDDQLRLQATLASQKQILDAADARERDRNASLKDALAQIDALKRAAQNQTPAQLARALQDALQLPQPITITPPIVSSSPQKGTGAPLPENAVGAQHALPERPTNNAAPSSDAPVNDTSPTSSAQQGTAPGKKSLFDALFHRSSPRTQADAKAASSSASSQPGVRSVPRDVPDSASAASRSSTPPSLATEQGTAHPLPSFNTANAAAPSPLPQSPTAQSATPQSSTHFPDPSLSSAAQLSAAKPSESDALLPAPQPNATKPSATAEIPAADLAPLYDYIQDCRACQLRLTAAKQNATDDAAKIDALTRERDAAVTAAKGGTFWLRLKRNPHWLAVGAAIGVVTSTAALCRTGHCR